MALVGGGGSVRGGKQRRGESVRGREREGWTAPDGCVASPRMDRLEGEASSAKQEVAGVDARHASPLLVLLAEEEEDKGGGGGLGRPLGPPGKPR